MQSFRAASFVGAVSLTSLVFSQSGRAQSCEPGWDPAFEQTLANTAVKSLLAIDSGAANDAGVFVGGAFTDIAGQPMLRIAQWDGAAWSPVGEGFDKQVLALTRFNGSVYAGGGFTTGFTSTQLRGVARWDGAAWQPLGSGISGANGLVGAFASFQDSRGESLYAGGSFTVAGGVSAAAVARWDGEAWSALDTGLLGGGTDKAAAAMISHDDGAGAALYVGGFFLGAGGQASPNVVRWTGSTWEAVGAGLDGHVRAFVIYDGELIAAGDFTQSGSTPVAHLARWDGTSWSTFAGGANGPVRAAHVMETNDGPRLVIGGEFSLVGGVSALRIAAYDGVSWAPFGEGTPTLVRAFARSGDSLYAGADTSGPNGGPLFPSLHRWILCDTGIPADFNGDGLVNGIDLASLLAQWGVSAGPADLNGDGLVNGADLAALLASWTTAGSP